ncbi:hypothetical protein [Pseudomonas sp.]|uniref:hypothetical protein n=1 Tax=Pseudomonas sp. TaxID=306 RepID=UPI0028B00B64|nr:hypothetical protein [Pseudomonas sp.]
MTGPSGIGRSHSVSSLDIQPIESHSRDSRQAIADVSLSSNPPILLKTHNKQPKALGQELTSKLQSDMARLGKISQEDKVALAKHHMIMEGRLLNSNTDHDFSSAQNTLEAMGQSRHPWTNFRINQEDFQKEFAELSKGKFSAEDLQQLHNNCMNKAVNQMSAYHSLYDEVLSGNLSPEERKHVESAKKAFGVFADSIYKNAESDFNSRISQCEEIIGSRVDKLTADLAAPGLAKEAKAGLETQLSEWKGVKDNFNKKTEGNSVSEDKANWKNGLAHIRRDNFVAELNEQKPGFIDLARIFADYGVPQGLASLLHFGYARNAAENSLEDQNFAAQSFGTGAALGVAHKAVTDFPRALAQLAMDNTIGLGLKPVSAMEVFPNAPAVISRNGEMYERSSDELGALNNVAKQHRQGFTDVQSASKFGTLSGDFAGFLSFGTTHMLRVIAHEFGEANLQSIHAKAVASAVAGMAMAGGQAVAQATATYGTEKIPTHRTFRVQQPLDEQVKAMGAKMLESAKFWKGASRDDLVSKIAGATEGILLSNLLGLASDAIPGKDDLEKQISLRELSSEEIGDRIGKALITFLQSPAVLQPFFANNQAGAEAAKAKVDRTQIGPENMTNPGRSSLPHGTPAGTKRRVLENTFDRTRGLSQVIPQAFVEPRNAARHVASGISSTASGISSAVNNMPTPTLRRRPAQTNAAAQGNTTTGEHELQNLSSSREPDLERGESNQQPQR